MNIVRVVLAILYSAALIFSLTRCSPNAASVDKAVLQSLRHQNGTIDTDRADVNVDSSGADKQAVLKFHYVSSKEFQRVKGAALEKGEVRMRLTSNQTNTGSLDDFSERGEADVSVAHSSKFRPVEIWVQLASDELVNQAETESCSLVVEPSKASQEASSSHEGRENSWHVSMRETADCKSRQEILANTVDVLVSFRAKDPSYHLVDSSSASDTQ